MFELVLYRPEIPPNTGNIIRLCANTGTRLHLVRPLGFALEDRHLRRAGLDYHELADVVEHESLRDCLAVLAGSRLFTVSTRGHAAYASIGYQRGDAFVLGAETSGLPDDVLGSAPTERRLRIPMRAGNRSLNLSNAAAVLIYEAWRQLGFEGGA